MPLPPSKTRDEVIDERSRVHMRCASRSGQSNVPAARTLPVTGCTQPDRRCMPITPYSQLECGVRTRPSPRTHEGDTCLWSGRYLPSFTEERAAADGPGARGCFSHVPGPACECTCRGLACLILEVRCPRGHSAITVCRPVHSLCPRWCPRRSTCAAPQCTCT